MNLSIIIPSYKSEETIELCLDSVLSQKTKLKYEIIVVDSSPNNLVAKIIKKYPQIKFIKVKKRTFPGIARNIGVKKAKGELLIFLDSDIVLDSSAIKNSWNYFKKGYLLCGGKINLYKKNALRFTSLLEHLFFLHESLKSKLCKRNNLNSAFMAIDKKVFLECKGFKKIPRMQDTELTERLKSQNIIPYFIPSIICYHNHRSSFSDLIKKIYINGNNIYFIRYVNNINIFNKLRLLLFLPLITFIKMTRINLRNLFYYPFRYKLQVIFSVPFIYFFGLFWMAGFCNAILFNKGISESR